MNQIETLKNKSELPAIVTKRRGRKKKLLACNKCGDTLVTWKIVEGHWKLGSVFGGVHRCAGFR